MTRRPKIPLEDAVAAINDHAEKMQRTKALQKNRLELKERQIEELTSKLREAETLLQAAGIEIRAETPNMIFVRPSEAALVLRALNKVRFNLKAFGDETPEGEAINALAEQIERVVNGGKL